ncbi:MAG TPA: hypothetical protein VLA84_24455, partial [Microcoleus sp.]|nr:hypothetical protein [Microcoleus sp.]
FIWEHLTFSAKLEIGVLRQEALLLRGRRKEEEGKRKKERGRRKEEEGRRKKEGGRRSVFTNMRCSLLFFINKVKNYPSSVTKRKNKIKIHSHPSSETTVQLTLLIPRRSP